MDTTRVWIGTILSLRHMWRVESLWRVGSGIPVSCRTRIRGVRFGPKLARFVPNGTERQNILKHNLKKSHLGQYDPLLGYIWHLCDKIRRKVVRWITILIHVCCFCGIHANRYCGIPVSCVVADVDLWDVIIHNMSRYCGIHASRLGGIHAPVATDKRGIDRVRA